MGNLPFSGVPLLGVPENPTEHSMGHDAFLNKKPMGCLAYLFLQQLEAPESGETHPEVPRKMLERKGWDTGSYHFPPQGPYIFIGFLLGK